MQTNDYHPDHGSSHGFDPETARLASLQATLSRVRLHRRVRRTAVAGLVLGAYALAAKFMIPSPALPPDSPPVVAESSPLRVRTLPLSPEQRIMTVTYPGLRMQTPEASVATLRVSTPGDSRVPRLGEKEFRALLAAHYVFLIQMSGGSPEVRPLQRE